MLVKLSFDYRSRIVITEDPGLKSSELLIAFCTSSKLCETKWVYSSSSHPGLDDNIDLVRTNRKARRAFITIIEVACERYQRLDTGAFDYVVLFGNYFYSM